MDALLAACEWVDGKLGELAIARSADLTAQLAGIKVNADLAHAADCLERSARPELAAIGTRWLERAWQHIDRGALVRDLVARYPTLAPTAVALLAFELSGRKTHGLVISTPPDALPPLAWTMLVPALDIFGVDVPPAARERGKPTSMLATRTSPDVMPGDAAYVLAHECMYETRWGRRAPAWAPDTAAYVEHALARLVARATAEADSDLLAELVLAMHLTGAACAPAAAWQVLDTARTPAGNVEPSPRLVTMFPRLPHPTLARTFHTTLVAIMAWAMCRHHSP